jgi:hypothetical protein
VPASGQTGSSLKCILLFFPTSRLSAIPPVLTQAQQVSIETAGTRWAVGGAMPVSFGCEQGSVCCEARQEPRHSLARAKRSPVRIPKALSSTSRVLPPAHGSTQLARHLLPPRTAPREYGKIPPRLARADVRSGTDGSFASPLTPGGGEPRQVRGDRVRDPWSGIRRRSPESSDVLGMGASWRPERGVRYRGVGEWQLDVKQLVLYRRQLDGTWRIARMINNSNTY